MLSVKKIILSLFATFLMFACQKRADDFVPSDNGSNYGENEPSPEVETVINGGYEISGTTEVIVDRKVSGSFVIEGVLSE